MISFIGNFEHNLDSKNRLFIPAKFREGLTNTFYIKELIDPDYPCIQCIRKEDFDSFVEQEMSEKKYLLSSRMMRFANFSFSSDVSVDSQGRIMIPQGMVNNLGLTKEAIIAGMGDHVEIWNPDTFKAYYSYVNEQYAKVDKSEEDERQIMLERKSKGEFIPMP